MLTPGISVVLCCYNSAEVIQASIRSLSAQDIPEGMGYELILVDNNCTDDSISLAQSAWKDTPFPLIIVKETQPGLIYARKAGVLKARYSILLFVDDDNILENDWVKRLVELYDKWPEVGGIGGYNIPLFEGELPSWFTKYSGMYACTPPHENPSVSAYKLTLFGAGLSLRTDIVRSIFESDLPLFLVGRTNHTLKRGDDSEICLRARLMGWKLWYENSLKLKHILLKNRVNWEYALRARNGGGHADIILKIYYDLLEDNIPLKYNQLSQYIASQWEEFWKLRIKYNDLINLPKEGEHAAMRYHYLTGLTEGFWEWEKNEYNTMRERIIRFFSKK